MAPPLLKPKRMARRVSALFGIVAIVGLVLVIAWNVYRHHEGARLRDEPAMVAIEGLPI